MLRQIDHVAFAVPDADQAARFFEQAFGVHVAHREHIERDQVDEVLLAVGDGFVQLLSPAGPESTVARFLNRRGPGLHHVGFRVEDCGAAMERLRLAGLELLDEAPRPGSRGTTVAFVQPRSALGVLIELVEEPSRPRLDVGRLGASDETTGEVAPG
jgi:methylmalonyl-CoA/ethylmalonyl-CoA epimerase